MIDAGRLDISVAKDAVRITSTRSREIAGLFLGKTPAHVATLVPAVFTICGSAQGRASALCLGTAGAPLPHVISGAQVAAEALREHLMRIAIDWQADMSAQPAAAADLRRIHRLPRLAAENERLCGEEAMGLLEHWIGSEDCVLDGSETLAKLNTPAARLIAHVAARGWQGLGAAEASMDNERTAYRLVAAEPCMMKLVRLHKDGLLTRLYARLVHAAHLVRRILSDVAGNADWPSCGPGEAHVETSRGLLTHRAALANGFVSAYEITAPTDINFAVDGPAERGLLALARNMQDDLAETARLLVDAFDPCVAYNLRVQ